MKTHLHGCSMKTAHCPFLALQNFANFCPSAYSPAHHAEGFAEGENVHHVITADAAVGSVPFLGKVHVDGVDGPEVHPSS